MITNLEPYVERRVSVKYSDEPYYIEGTITVVGADGYFIDCEGDAIDFDPGTIIHLYDERQSDYTNAILGSTNDFLFNTSLDFCIEDIKILDEVYLEDLDKRIGE